jgi:hypothetical protein
MAALMAYDAVAGDRCLYCDRRATGGERWLWDGTKAPEGWIFCSPHCYATTVEACGWTPETQVAKKHAVIDLLAYYERTRYNDALTAGQKALAEVR